MTDQEAFEALINFPLQTLEIFFLPALVLYGSTLLIRLLNTIKRA